VTPPSTVDRIATAALAILTEEGSTAVTMRRVATAAGITAMAIYKHYANREVLLLTVADAAFNEIGASWGNRHPNGDWPTRVNDLLDDFLDFALGQPHLYGFLLTERRDDARRFPDDFDGDQSPIFSHVVRIVEEGIQAGILRPDDPLELTLCVTAPTQGLVQLYRGGRIGLSEDEFRFLCRRIVWRIFDGIKA
jgi:AcrR family transcriptional regulator